MEERKEKMISIRLPGGLLAEIDRVIERGQAESRSDFFRRVASLHLLLESPELKQTQMRARAGAIPVLATLSQGFDSILAELAPEQLRKLLEIVVDPLSKYYERVLRIPASQIRKELLRQIDEVIPVEGKKSGKRRATAR